MKFWLNPNVRFYPQLGIDSSWVISNMDTKKEARVSSSICLLLAKFIGGAKISSVKKELPSKQRKEVLSTAIAWLIDNEYLLKTDLEYKDRASMVDFWHAHNWYESLDYHLLTYSYPFEDYSNDGETQDRKKMDEYRELDIEPSRTKQYMLKLSQYEICNTKSACSQIKARSFDVLGGACNYKDWKTEDLLNLASIAFGKLRGRKVNATPPVEELIRKTSPSGGCRHPAEGYFFCTKMDGIESGIYHFCVKTNSLDKISELPQTADLNMCFDGLLRAPFTPKVFVVMTTVFERNMFRYREPRTFRTPFMDVGHLIGTLELSAHGLGMKTFVHHGIDDQKIEALLGIDELSETVVYGVAIG
ncbi:SagB/ThcOx family dehydrogenase [Pseudomonas anguilliseptica]|uniref:SagB/ThcOx family dehydrogenase n=1 Tax=Pseudomonas anguilliseptica TaxID=53406 RepID=UPI003735CD2F